MEESKAEVEAGVSRPASTTEEDVITAAAEVGAGVGRPISTTGMTGGVLRQQ